MKKTTCLIILHVLILLLSAPLCAAEGIQLPEEYRSAFNDTDWSGCSAADWFVVDAAAYGLVVMQKGDQNLLCLIERQEDHRWKIGGINEKILRPGTLEMDDPQISGWDDCFWVCYRTPDNDRSANWPEAYNFDRTEHGAWRLSGYAYYDSRQDIGYGLRLEDDSRYWVHTRGEAELNEAYVAQTPDLNFASIDPATMNAFIDDAVEYTYLAYTWAGVAADPPPGTPANMPGSRMIQVDMPGSSTPAVLMLPDDCGPLEEYAFKGLLITVDMPIHIERNGPYVKAADLPALIVPSRVEIAGDVIFGQLTEVGTDFVEIELPRSLYKNIPDGMIQRYVVDEGTRICIGEEPQLEPGQGVVIIEPLYNGAALAILLSNGQAGMHGSAPP